MFLENEDAKTLVSGEKVTLMKWGNVRLTNVVVKEDGSIEITAEDLPDDKDYKGTKKINWLA